MCGIGQCDKDCIGTLWCENNGFGSLHARYGTTKHQVDLFGPIWVDCRQSVGESVTIWERVTVVVNIIP